MRKSMEKHALSVWITLFKVPPPKSSQRPVCRGCSMMFVEQPLLVGSLDFFHTKREAFLIILPKTYQKFETCL